MLCRASISADPFWDDGDQGNQQERQLPHNQIILIIVPSSGDTFLFTQYLTVSGARVGGQPRVWYTSAGRQLKLGRRDRWLPAWCELLNTPYSIAYVGIGS